MYNCYNCGDSHIFRLTISHGKPKLSKINPYNAYYEPKERIERTIWSETFDVFQCTNCQTVNDDLLVPNPKHNKPTENFVIAGKRRGKRSESTKPYVCGACGDDDVNEISMSSFGITINGISSKETSRFVKQRIEESKLISPDICYYEVYWCMECKWISDDLVIWQPEYRDQLSPRAREKEYRDEEEEYRQEMLKYNSKDDASSE